MIFASHYYDFWGILPSIRTIRNTRTIRVFCQKLFYIRASTIPTRIGNPSLCEPLKQNIRLLCTAQNVVIE